MVLGGRGGRHILATKKRRISDTRQVTFWYDHVPDITWDDLRVKTVVYLKSTLNQANPTLRPPGGSTGSRGPGARQLRARAPLDLGTRAGRLHPAFHPQMLPRGWVLDPSPWVWGLTPVPICPVQGKWHRVTLGLVGTGLAPGPSSSRP